MAANLELRDFIKGGNESIVKKILSTEIPLPDDETLNAPPPYRVASVDEGKVELNPLLSTKTLQLHVYDYEAPVDADSLATVEICKQNWQSGGVMSFNGDGKSFVVAGETVENATWDPTKSVLSWSAQSCSIPEGIIAFSDDKVTAVGAMSDASGQEVTIAGTNLAYYVTKRYRDGSDPSTAEDFATFTFGAAPPEAGSPLEPVYHMHFQPGQNPSSPEGGMDDISTECVVNPSLKLADPLVIKKGYDNEHQYCFEITFDSLMESFTGIFEEGPLKEKFHWTGTQTSVPPTVIKEEAPSPGALITPIFNLSVPTMTPEFEAIQVAGNPPPSYEKAMDWDSEKPVQASFAPSSNNKLRLQDLLHLSSIITAKVKVGDKEEYVVKDYAQECASKSFNNILLASVPDQTRQKLFPNVLPLTQDEIKIKDKHSAFFSRAGTPYLAMYISQSQHVDQNIKKHIDVKKVQAFFAAAGSINEPEKDDPVKQLGWDRKSEDFKNLQNAFITQNMDMYRLGYAVGVPAFQPFLADPKRWHDEMSAYLTKPTFLARWGVQNSLVGFADGRRQLYEYETQLQCLQVAAEDRGLKTNLSTMDVVEKLTAAMLIPSFDQVNWTDEMKQQFKAQLDTIMGFTKDELDEIMKESMEKYLQYQLMQELVKVHGDSNALTDSVSKIMRANSKHLSDAGAPVSAKSSVSLAERQSVKTFSFLSDEKIEKVRESLGPAFNEQAVNELRTSKWRKCWDVCKNVGSTIWSVLKPVLYIAGAAYAVYTLCNDPGVMDPMQKSQLGGIALEMAFRGLTKIVQSKFGDWLRTVLLNKNSITKVLGEWFTKEGVVSIAGDSKAGKALLACFGKNCGDFLQYRVGPAMALIAIGVTAWQLARAIQHGTTHDIVFASINLALAIVSAVVVFVGLFAKGAIAAACGPIGIAIIVIGLIVFAIEFFTRDKPAAPVTPTEEFVNGPLKTAGFYID